MQYKKLISGETVIEFHNNWLGEETVIANGQIVSKKSSIWGTNHYFTVMEDGHQSRYILTTKVNDYMQVAVDLSKNGELVHENVPVSFGLGPKRSQNKAKKQGLLLLKEYDLDDALEAFEKALKEDPKDHEVHFHMACAYSVLEDTVKGFEAIKKAKQNGLQDQETILNHDMLAFLRMHEAFEDFLNSGFTEYEIKRLEK